MPTEPVKNSDKSKSEASDGDFIPGQTEPATVVQELSAPPVQFVVGIGASAGGLQSIEKLLRKIDPQTGAAFVVVQHFSPDVVSSMDKILARSTNLKIAMAADGVELEPDTVFLIPPGEELRVSDNRFQVTKADRSKLTRVIDVLLISLAKAHGEKSIGIILSGTGSDGSEGIQAISKAGGTTIAESFETAQFDGMPKSAVQTGCIDYLIPTQEIAHWLNRQFLEPNDRPEVESSIPFEQLSGIQLVFALLAEKHEVDFSAYKPSTVVRRIERRQQICRIKSFNEYAEFAKGNFEELDLLYHDLLIGVTKFFRDTDAFLALERCLVEMIKKIPEGEPLRLWSAGCASGEEAYSLAMLAHETFERLGREPLYKVFATDLHQRSLDFASRGIYSTETMEYVSEERQQKFFFPENKSSLRVSNLLRKNMVFAQHNVFNDASFTRMHVVTCRNLLIYLKNEAQLKAISSFHFALRIDGIMMLGSSETTGPLADEFRTIDEGWRIFQKIRDRPNLLAKYLGKLHVGRSGARQLVNILNKDRPNEMSFTRLIESYDLVLGQFVKSGLLLDEDRCVRQVFGNASDFLNDPDNRQVGSLSGFLEGDAKVAIIAGLMRAQKDHGKIFVIRDLEMLNCGRPERVDVQVRALEGSAAGAKVVWLVEFFNADLELSKSKNDEDASESKVDIRAIQASGEFSELETELVYTKDSLNMSIIQLESSNEELSKANEELVSANEELQSTNEELESVNEELYTVNLENSRRIDELKEVTDDLEVLLSTSDVGTLFLDADLCVRKFTKSIMRYINLLPHDVGRPISDFSNKSGITDLDERLSQVLETGVEFTDEMLDRDGVETRVKIVQHHMNEKVAGVILTMLRIGSATTADSPKSIDSTQSTDSSE